MKKVILFLFTVIMLHAYNYGTYEGNIAECKNKNPKACNDLAGMYLIGRNAHMDKAKAKIFYDKSIKFYEQKCNNKDAKACFDLANKYNGTRWGIKSNYKTMISYYTKSCKYKYGKACQELGSAYKRGWFGVKKDLNKSKKMYDKAIAFYTQECENNNPNSCYSLGLIYKFELYGTNDATQAIKYDKKAFELNKANCDKNNSKGCFYIATIYSSGDKSIGIKKDANLTRKFLEKSCKLGESGACYEIEK